MLRHAHAKTAGSNPCLKDLPRNPGESNYEWVQRALADMPLKKPEAWTRIALVGGTDTVSFRLRLAQGHVRTNDMLPSYWSDVLLIDFRRPVEASKAIQVPFDQPAAPHFAPYYNGVVERPLQSFADATLYPNLALIALPVPHADIMRRVDTFKQTRATLDTLEHLLRWLAFVWGVAKMGNPLHENYGFPSACMLETVFAAEGFDLTPGLESRASCPEAIWAAAKRWHEYYKKTVAGGDIPNGRFTIDHKYNIIGSPDDLQAASRGDSPSVEARSAPSKRGAEKKPAKASKSKSAQTSRSKRR